MAPRDTETIATVAAAEVPTLATKEAPEVPEVLVKFGELELAEVDTEQDPDYSPSEADTEDSLEYSSETERTFLEDAMMEGKLGKGYTDFGLVYFYAIDEGTVLEDALVEGKVGTYRPAFTDAAVTIATEYLSSYKAVQLGLAAEEAVMGLVEANLPIPAILPTISKIRRSARAAKRAGAKHIEVVRSEPSLVTTMVNYLLSFLGLEVVSVCEGSAKKHLTSGTMPYTPCVEFGAMDLSDYDSDQDADYSPSELEESDDSIEYDSEAEVSSEEEEEETEEASEDAEEIEEAVVVA